MLCFVCEKLRPCVRSFETLMKHAILLSLCHFFLFLFFVIISISQPFLATRIFFSLLFIIFVFVNFSFFLNTTCLLLVFCLFLASLFSMFPSRASFHLNILPRSSLVDFTQSSSIQIEFFHVFSPRQ